MTPEELFKANAEHIMRLMGWRDPSILDREGKLIIDPDRYMLVEYNPKASPPWTVSFHRRVVDAQAFLDEDRAEARTDGGWWPIALVDLSDGSCYPVRVQHQVSAWPNGHLETSPSVRYI